MGDMMNYMMGFGLLMVVSVILVVIGITLLLVWLARRSSRGSSNFITTPGAGAGPTQEAPLAILQRRYALGEIGPEEYEQIRSDLLRDGDSHANGDANGHRGSQ